MNEAIDIIKHFLDFASGSGVYKEIFAIEEDAKREELATRAWKSLRESAEKFVFENDRIQPEEPTIE